MNKYAPHVYIIPEDDRNRQMAEGFTNHDQVLDRRIQVMPPAGGWSNVRRTFEEEYVQTLRKYPLAHVVMLIDFDGHFDERRKDFDMVIPADVRDRVFVIGSSKNPESLKKAMSISFEAMGRQLAEDCHAGTLQCWNHEQLVHNNSERERLVRIVKPFLFP